MVNFPSAAVTLVNSVPLQVYSHLVHSLTSTPANGWLFHPIEPLTSPVVGSRVGRGVKVGLGTNVRVGVEVGARVAVLVGVADGKCVAVAVGVDVGDNRAASAGIPQTANEIIAASPTRPMNNAGMRLIFLEDAAGGCVSGTTGSAGGI